MALAHGAGSLHCPFYLVGVGSVDLQLVCSRLDGVDAASEPARTEQEDGREAGGDDDGDGDSLARLHFGRNVGCATEGVGG